MSGLRPHAPIILALALLAASWAGCVAEDRGTLIIYVKGTHHDDFEGLFVTFSSVHAHRAGAEADADADRGPGWVTLRETPFEIDLLAFTLEGTRALVANGTYERGAFDQLVIGIDRPRAVQPNETRDPVVDLAEEQVRVSAQFRVEPRTTTVVLVTFDLNGSLEEQDDRTYLWTPLVSDVTVDEDATRLQRTISNEGVVRHDQDGGAR